ncbi:MAG: GNAT family N-acetyltransferase [Ignavibacteria bacterium]|nr:GNAT family N-acetyltransferase [Ignavibacteria bacterium]
MEIIKFDPNHKKKAAAVVAAAFFNYPMFTFYFPDEKERTKKLPWYMEQVLNCALSYGEVYTNPEISGVVFTLPPGHTKLSQWEYTQHGFLFTPIVLGWKDFIRSQECEAFVTETHERLMKNRLHYYLWGLTVDPKVKGQGIGSALLMKVLDIADAAGMPMYLETHDEKNVAYYAGKGFSLISTEKFPHFDLDFWCMVREPSFITG